MGIADISLGEAYCLVFGLYCFKCKEQFNFAYTLTWLREQFNEVYAKHVPLRPPLLLPPPDIQYTEQDLNFLTALRIAS